VFILQSIFSITLIFIVCLGVFNVEDSPFFLAVTTLLSVIILFLLENFRPLIRSMRLSIANIVLPTIGGMILYLLQVPIDITQLLVLAIIFFIINSFYEKWQHHLLIVLLLFFSVIAIIIELFFNSFEFKFLKPFIDLSLIIFPLGLYLLLQSHQLLLKLIILVLLAILALPLTNISLGVFELSHLNWKFLSLLTIGVLSTSWLVFIFSINASRGGKKIFIFLGFSNILALLLLNALLFIITIALLFLAFKPLARVTKKRISKTYIRLLLLASIGFLIFIGFEYYKNTQANIFYQQAKQQTNEEAIETLTKGLYYGSNGRYLELLGDLYFKTKQLKLAEGFYKRALEVSLEKQSVFKKLAKIYRKQKKSKKLIKVLRERLDFAKTNENFLALAKTLRRYGFYHKTLEIYKMAYEFDSNNADYCYNYGVILATVEQYELATEVLLKGLSIDNDKRFKVILKAIKDGKNITLE
jgi:tetratricopeptide (TPR) repeat protein